MNIFGDLLRGHTDMILLSVLEKNDSYGYLINKQIEKLTDNEFSFTEATLYTSFKRLVQLGYVTTYWLESDSGKKRKYYSITSQGLQYLTVQNQEWKKIKTIIDKIIKA
ncbi:MAG: PadR family transcriptional regulator [Firmicutes bacterium]|nr:PadR family transcriptional regulator [Bacillota bacterium]